MWIKLDDGFPTHPKILQAGPLGLAIQVRAICYASKNKTDGFLPDAAIGLFLLGLDLAFDWPAHMLERKLWDQVPGGYQIHDYLDWNPSKYEYELFINKKRKAGKKGMKARWGKEKSGITDAITDAITKRYQPTSTSSLSSPNLNSLSSLNSLNSLNSPNPDLKSRKHSRTKDKGPPPNWFDELRLNPLYAHVNFEAELDKIARWKLKPENTKRVLTRRFMINWLNRIDPPLSNGTLSLTCQHCQKSYPDQAALKTHQVAYHPKWEG